MKDFFKNIITNHKNKIVISSLVLTILFAFFVGVNFFTKKFFKTTIDMSQNIGKYSVINDDLYVFNEVFF